MVIKLRRMIWAECLARMEALRMQKGLIGEPEGKRLLEGLGVSEK
jgi:hypothetical protein